MGTVLIVIHLMVVVAMIGMVLLQRSEGGALGMGGGGGGGGFMSARGAANALTRSTGILAAAFFVTSITLSILAKYEARPTDVLDQVPVQTQKTNESKEGGVLDLLTPKKEEDKNDSTEVPTSN
ncbi:MAG: preprotein translocase subunit SecG [Hyphomicrobiales bacterium]|nr:preprotein translocase subunit SecG [Hyphomicrobiales bacterium]